MQTPAYRNLMLWRHADALPLSTEVTVDLNRPLSKKGHLQAEKMAGWLNKHLPSDTLLISSAALRAKQTLQALSDQFVVLNTLNPDATLEMTVKTLIDLPTNHQDKLNILIVGHQPWLGELAGFLLELKPSEMHIKKGALWWFKNATTATNPTYHLYCLQTPRLL